MCFTVPWSRPCFFGWPSCGASAPGHPGRTLRASLLQLAHMLHSALVKAILLDDLPVMQHVELLRCVLPGEQQDGLRATRVLREEIRHVIDIIAHNAPAILVRAVLSNLLRNDRHLNWRAEPRGSSRENLSQGGLSQN